jgi:hypothetical protein
VRVERPAASAASAPREVFVGTADERIAYHLEETQRDAQTSVTVAEPDDPRRQPRLELFAPAAAQKSTPGALLFSSGEPNQIASKVLARELAAHGVPTVVVPVLTGTPLDVPATIRLAAGLDALLPAGVDRSRVACVGIGLGAGPAVRAAAARNPDLAVLAFTTADLADRVAEDPTVAGGLGIFLPEARRRVKQQLGPMLREALAGRAATGRLLVLGLEGESRLPVADQRALLELAPKAETWWSPGSLRALQRDAAPAARRIAEFLGRP